MSKTFHNTSHPASERRIEPRNTRAGQGLLICLEERSTCQFQFIDQSPSGAQIQFDDSPIWKGTFWLLDLEQNKAMEIRVAWQRQSRWGVQVLRHLSLKAAPSLPDFVAEVWADQIRGKPLLL
ncbi:MAG: hypothetical protein ACK41P_09465 [Asticcacaulis sp.]